MISAQDQMRKARSDSCMSPPIHGETQDFAREIADLAGGRDRAIYRRLAEVLAHIPRAALVAGGVACP